MANKTISNFTTQTQFNATDELLLQRSSNYFSIEASNLIAHLDSDDLTEGGTNLYATTSNLDTYLATKDSDDLSEGSTNLYATNANLNTWLAGKDLDDVTDGSTYLRVGKSTTTINSAAMSTLNSNPIQVLTAGAWALPIGCTLKVTGGSTGYTVGSITELQLVAGNGSTYTSALFTAHPAIIATATTEIKPFGSVDGVRLDSTAALNWYFTCDVANPTAGNVEYEFDVYYIVTDFI